MAEELQDEKKQDDAEILIEKANKAAERAEQATKKAEEVATRLAQAEARARLGGKAMAGTGVEPKKEISNKDYAQSALKGQILT